jgi:hypothetical protein
MALLPVITTSVKTLLKEGTIKLAFFWGQIFTLRETKKIGIS